MSEFYVEMSVVNQLLWRSFLSVSGCFFLWPVVFLRSVVCLLSSLKIEGDVDGNSQL